jgi:outer membrane protein assembly factor BamB
MKRTVLVVALAAAFVPGPALAAPVDPALVPPVSGPVLIPPVADTDGPTVAQAATLTSAWSSTGDQSDSDLLYFAGSVYHGARGMGDGTQVGLIRRDAATGSRQPFAPAVPGTGVATPVTDGEAVFTLTMDRGESVVRAYRPDGAARWSAKIPVEEHTGWVLATGGLVLAAAEYGCGRYPRDICERTVLHAFRADTGRRAWTRKLTGGSPVVAAAGGRIAVRTWQDRDELYSDDHVEPGQDPAPIADDSPALVTVLTTGNRRLWQRAVPGGGDLAADARTVAVAGSRLCGYRATDGRTLWCAPKTHHYLYLTTADGRFYAGLETSKAPDDLRLAAFDGRTGRRLWTAPDARPYGGLTAGNGVVWLVSFTDLPVTQLLALRATDGRELRRLPLGEFSRSAVALGIGHAFIVRDLETIVAYR